MKIEEYKQLTKKPVRSKYGARRVEIDGIVFHSTKEGNRYQELKLMSRAGEIDSLKLQTPFPYFIKGKKIFEYRADFTYHDNKLGRDIIEDVKSPMTAKLPIYRLKKKIIEAEYNIEIMET